MLHITPQIVVANVIGEIFAQATRYGSKKGFGIVLLFCVGRYQRVTLFQKFDEIQSFTGSGFREVETVLINSFGQVHGVYSSANQNWHPSINSFMLVPKSIRPLLHENEMAIKTGSTCSLLLLQ